MERDGSLVLRNSGGASWSDGSPLQKYEYVNDKYEYRLTYLCKHFCNVLSLALNLYHVFIIF